MHRISIEEVCRQVLRRQSGAIDYAVENGMEVYPYALDEFEMDMMENDFIASRTTVVAKWKMLISSGIVSQRASRTFLVVGELRKRCEKQRGRAFA